MSIWSEREIYLDANATTPVLALAQVAACAAMEEDYGNPSSIHSTGLQAKALMERTREHASTLLGTGSGRLVFVSGATEGIQTAVLSALTDLRRRRDAGEVIGSLLLYGATDHKAVPEALAHWNNLLGLNLELRAIPVGKDGRHDLEFLKAYAPQAGLICTMACNNETGIKSDLDGIAKSIENTKALWLVDCVQALGKIKLNLASTRIDYAPFSGHKLYAPKGIGLLYVREGAPFTPLMAGGGQESSLRSGTENMSGIAALGAVLDALSDGQTFRDIPTLTGYRDQLLAALRDAFPGLCLNAPLEHALPTTINFSVPGLTSKELIDLFDAAGVRVSGGSACSAAKAQPSFVLQAMGLPAWQAASAIRLSIGPAADQDFIQEACARIRRCGEALRRTCLVTSGVEPLPADGVIQLTANGACTWLIADKPSGTCIVIDPLPELFERLAKYVHCQHYRVLAVLDTHSHADHDSAAKELIKSFGVAYQQTSVDQLGWPVQAQICKLKDGSAAPTITIGDRSLAKLETPGHTSDSVSYLLGRLSANGLSTEFAFCGDMVLIGGLGRTDFVSSSSEQMLDSLRRLAACSEPYTLLCPAHDYDYQFATTLLAERRVQSLLDRVFSNQNLTSQAFAVEKLALDSGINDQQCQALLCGARTSHEQFDRGMVEIGELEDFFARHPNAVLVDVREPYEQALSQLKLPANVTLQHVPLTRLVNHMSHWLRDTAQPLVFFCRSGSRSFQAVQCMRRLGYEHAWHMSGGIALWQKSH